MFAPALLAAVPLLAGAASAILLFDRLDQGFAFLAATAALLSLIAASASALQDDVAEASVEIACGCLLAGLSLGASAAGEVYRPPLLQWFNRVAPDEPVVVQGVLREDAAPTPFGVSLRIELQSAGTFHLSGRGLGGVRLTVGGTLAATDIGEWRAGRTVRVPALLRRPSTYFNPGTPDERLALARRGIALVGNVKSGALVEVVRRGGWVAETAAAIRAWTRARIAAHMRDFDTKSAGVTTAVLIGDRSGLASEDERRLQDAGTFHVIAISGSNIAILAVLGLALLRAALAPSPVAAALTACGLVFYGIVAGGAASVARAVTVAVIALAGRALDHRATPVNVLAAAAITAVAASPVAVLDAGFLLSFGATLGILAGVPLLVEVRPDREKGSRRLVRRARRAATTVLAATTCAEVMLAPVAATLFSRVTFAGLLLNFAAIPLMTVVQCAGFILVGASAWSPSIAGLAARAAHLGAAGLLESARLVDFAPWVTTSVPPPAFWLTAAYYVAALGVLLPRTRKAAVVLLVISGGGILTGIPLTSRDALPRARAPVRVVVVDVGQGDATIVQLPGRRALLVDAGGLASFRSAESDQPGGSFDIGERVVTPALRALGATPLEHLVITHADPDHVNGAMGVLRQVRTRSVWEGIPVPPNSALRALSTFARARGLSWRTVQAGDRELFGDVEVRVLHPAPPDWERQRVRNEDSVVLEIRIGEVSIVLPGDIGREAEQKVLPALEPGRLVVIKAPHHGSATSSTQEFLEALRPAAVIFSCGRDNRFGHPHPAVVARYTQLGARIFSTAEDGAVFVETDGTTVEVRGWVGRRSVFQVANR